jgi:hypothetical protein
MIRTLTSGLAIFLAGILLHADAGDLFVAVGYGGRRASSQDGINWEHDQRWSDEPKDDDNVLFNVAYGLGRFIAVGGGAKVGHILSTTDGKEWKELPRVKGRVATVVFGQGRFVAGHDSELLWSEDGEKFNAGEKLGFKGSVHARKSACGDTEAGFTTVIIGDVDLFAARTRVNWRGTTTNGERWTSQTLDTPAARAIAYGSGHFVVAGPDGLIESSHDGQNWKRHDTGSDDDFTSAIWTGERFIVAGGRSVWTSPDALHWKADPRRINCSVAWGRESQRTLGIGFSWGGNVWHSKDLFNWTKAQLPAGPSFNAVAARIDE